MVDSPSVPTRSFPDVNNLWQKPLQNNITSRKGPLFTRTHFTCDNLNLYNQDCTIRSTIWRIVHKLFLYWCKSISRIMRLVVTVLSYHYIKIFFSCLGCQSSYCSRLWPPLALMVDSRTGKCEESEFNLSLMSDNTIPVMQDKIST